MSNQISFLVLLWSGVNAPNENSRISGSNPIRAKEDTRPKGEAVHNKFRGKNGRSRAWKASCHKVANSRCWSRQGRRHKAGSDPFLSRRDCEETHWFCD